MTEDLPLGWHPDAPMDLTQLPPPVRREAVRLLALVKRQPRTGEWLSADDRTGDLSDCRKIVFGPDEDGRGPSYRLVYRLLPDNHAPVRVQVIAIGPKRDFLVYGVVAKRLGGS